MTDETDLARAAALGFEPMEDTMSFSSRHWEPTHGLAAGYEGMGPAEPQRPAWLPQDIITAVTPDEQEAVRHVQRVLRVPETGTIDPATRSAIMGVQQLFGDRATGVLDAETARCVDRLSHRYGGG